MSTVHIFLHQYKHDTPGSHIEITRTWSTKEEETWKPFQATLMEYGLAELMRRIQKGIIAARKDPEDDEEWQFRDVAVTIYNDNLEKSARTAEKSGKMEPAACVA